MPSDLAREFPIDPGLVPLNHASFGIPTTALLARSEQLRRELERDANVALGDELDVRLSDIAGQVHDWLGLPGGQLALTRNTTEAAAAVAASLPLDAGDHVVLLDAEYSSVIHGWEVACRRAGARLTIASLPLPVRSPDDILGALRAIPQGPLTYLQVSQVTSSAALVLPLADLARFAADRGGRLVVDAAHGPGHVDVGAVAAHAGIVFGTLHKWLPVPRGVGFLWAHDALANRLSPAEASLPYAAGSLAARFSWPGTYDPTPRLLLPDAIRTWRRWSQAGLLTEAARLADRASNRLEDLGVQPTGPVELRPPRLRSVVLPRVDLPTLRSRLQERHIRAWTGADPAGQTLLRISTHVYSDDSDLDVLVETVDDIMRTGPCAQ